jgi:adenosine deaminase
MSEPQDRRDEPRHCRPGTIAAARASAPASAVRPAGQRPRRCLSCLPKADLHLHLEGAMRRQQLTEMAHRNGRLAPQLSEHADFDALSRLYRFVVSLIGRPQDLRRLVREAAEDAAGCGAVWIEPQFNPMNYSPAVRPRPEDVMELVLEAAADASRESGVGVGIMLAASRSRGPQHVSALARLAARYAGRGVVAFGLAGDERAAGAGQFTEAFAVARNAGLICAPHAGEFLGAAHLQSAVDELAPRRIAHGIRAAESPALMDHLVG